MRLYLGIFDGICSHILYILLSFVHFYPLFPLGVRLNSKCIRLEEARFGFGVKVFMVVEEKVAFGESVSLYIFFFNFFNIYIFTCYFQEINSFVRITIGCLG